MDTKDNKLIFGPSDKAMLKRCKPYTNLMMKPQRMITMEDVLAVNPELSSQSRLSAQALRQLALCPFIDWSKLEEVDLFDS